MLLILECLLGSAMVLSPLILGVVARLIAEEYEARKHKNTKTRNEKRKAA